MSGKALSSHIHDDRYYFFFFVNLPIKYPTIKHITNDTTNVPILRVINIITSIQYI